MFQKFIIEKLVVKLSVILKLSENFILNSFSNNYELIYICRIAFCIYKFSKVF